MPEQTPDIVKPMTFPPQSLKMPSYSGTKIEKGDASIDYGNASDGYVIATYKGGTKAVVKVTFSTEAYDYHIPGDGTPMVLPLQFGSGMYSFSFIAPAGDSGKFFQLLSLNQVFTVNEENSPFLLPNLEVNYNPESESVKKAWELSKDCKSDVEVVAAVYDFIKNNIAYDREKADLIGKGEYENKLPDADETLLTKKGICYDYACLAAVMLRANGIPAKLVKGYVQNGSLYHAWNLIYLENYGWVEKRLYVDLNTWEIVDTTFAANMDSDDLANYIGEGDNYATRFIY